MSHDEFTQAVAQFVLDFNNKLPKTKYVRKKEQKNDNL